MFWEIIILNTKFKSFVGILELHSMMCYYMELWYFESVSFRIFPHRTIFWTTFLTLGFINLSLNIIRNQATNSKTLNCSKNKSKMNKISDLEFWYSSTKFLSLPLAHSNNANTFISSLPRAYHLFSKQLSYPS